MTLLRIKQYRFWSMFMVFLLISTIFIAFFVSMPVVSANWYDNNWSYKKSITIDNTKVSGTSDLSNFPVLIKIDDDTDLQECQADGDDIIFVNSAENALLDWEIEYFDNTDADLVAWVEIPTLDYNDDTTIYMYYGNSGATDQSDASGTWNSNYIAVWHLSESSGTIYDSTANNHDSVTVSAPTYGNTGKVGSCLNFDGINDYVDFGDDDDFSLWESGDDATVEIWSKQETEQSDAQHLGKGVEWQTHWINIVSSNNAVKPRFDVWGDNTVDEVSEDVDINTWYYHAWRMDAGSYIKTYTNGGTAITTTTTDTSANGAYSMQIGALHDGSGHMKNPFDGNIDEVRLSDIQRSEGWITTTYNTISAPSSFFSIGSEEVVPSLWTNHNPVNAVWLYSDATQDVPLTPTLKVNVSDADISNQTLNVTWQYYDTDHWYTFGYNDTSINATLQQTLGNASEYGVSYTWRILTHDNHSTLAWDNDSQSFRTIYNISQYNILTWDGSRVNLANDYINDSTNRTLLIESYSEGSGWTASGAGSICKSPDNDTYYISGRYRTGTTYRGHNIYIKKCVGTITTQSNLIDIVNISIENITNKPTVFESTEGNCLRYLNGSYYFYFCIDHGAEWDIYVISASTVEEIAVLLTDGNNWQAITVAEESDIKDPMVYEFKNYYYIIIGDNDYNNNSALLYKDDNPEFTSPTLIEDLGQLYKSVYSGIEDGLGNSGTIVYNNGKWIYWGNSLHGSSSPYTAYWWFATADDINDTTWVLDTRRIEVCDNWTADNAVYRNFDYYGVDEDLFYLLIEGDYDYDGHKEVYLFNYVDNTPTIISFTVSTNSSNYLDFNDWSITASGFGLTYEYNVSERNQTDSAAALCITNTGNVALDLIAYWISDPGSCVSLKYNTTNNAPNPGTNTISVSPSSTSIIINLEVGESEYLWFWMDYLGCAAGSGSVQIRFESSEHT